jgi:multiple sugar transport system substrate-binding protein
MSNGMLSRRSAAWLAAGLLGAATLPAAPRPAQAADLVFLSTQLRPIEEAQKLRNDVLSKAPVPSTFVPEATPEFTVRAKAEIAGGTHTISLLGALHGELQPLATLGALEPLDALATRLAARGFPDNLMALGRFGGQHQLYIPWMQATYVMVANKKALPFLPPGADLKTLTYAQLAAWAQAIQAKTGNRALGFPAGPTGLMPRFFEGYLYPSFTGGVVAPFRSPAAEAMWAEFATLWKSVTPNSTNYNFMQEPLLTGEVWIAWDHVARIQDALRQKPDDFVVFPAPAGPKGRGYMPVIAGLAIAKGAPDAAGAASLIDYLTRPTTQIQTLRSSSFFPTVKATIPNDLDPGLKLTEIGVAEMQSAPDAKPSLLPIGLGDKGGAFDKVFLDTFQLIVLRGQKPHDVLPREGEAMQRIMTDTGAPCWAPDPPSTGACQVQ